MESMREYKLIITQFIDPFLYIIFTNTDFDHVQFTKHDPQVSLRSHVCNC
jgi:hypothetical protein